MPVFCSVATFVAFGFAAFAFTWFLLSVILNPFYGFDRNPIGYKYRIAVFTIADNPFCELIYLLIKLIKPTNMMTTIMNPIVTR